MLQKITYTSKEANSYVYFVLSSTSDFDPDCVTEALEIQPSSTRLKGDPIPKTTNWEVRREVGSSPDLKTATHEIISLLKDKVNQIKDIKVKYNLNAHLIYKVDIDVHPDISTPYFPLDVEIISFLHAISAEVDIDIYKADSRGIHLK